MLRVPEPSDSSVSDASGGFSGRHGLGLRVSEDFTIPGIQVSIKVSRHRGLEGLL